MNKDLTVGSPSKVLWRFCLPLFGSVLFQQFYNLADSIIAGRFIGENALAAIGNSYEITFIFLAFAFGCNMGCSVVVSKFFGSKEYGKMKTAISTTTILTILTCLTLMIIGLLGGEYLLKVIDTPTELLSDSKLYLFIYIYGLPFLFFYNVSGGIFSALGDSKTPFIFLAFSSTSNVVVDVLFVKVFEMGVAGVAWATFLCQGVSCVLAVIFVILRIQKMNIEEKSQIWSFDILKNILQIGIPSVFQQGCVSIGNIIIQKVINGYGPATIAGYAAAIKLNNLVISSFVTISNGISNYTAQNLGAKKLKRVKAGLISGLKLVFLIAVPIILAYILLATPLLSVFIKEPTEEALRAGSMFLYIVSPFYFFVAIKIVSDGVLRGGGMMKAFLVSTFTDLTIRVVLAILLSKTSLGSTGIWSAWPLGWIIAAIISFLYQIKCPWNKKECQIK